MTRIQMLGLGLVGLGAVLLFLADDSGYFGAMIEIAEEEEGPTVKMALKTQLGPSLETNSSQALELPEPPT